MAISRSRMLWALEPVKYMRPAPHASMAITRTSTWRPPLVSTEDFASPWAITRSTTGRDTNRSMTDPGLSLATSRSMSPMVSAIRRSEPA